MDPATEFCEMIKAAGPAGALSGFGRTVGQHIHGIGSDALGAARGHIGPAIGIGAVGAAVGSLHDLAGSAWNAITKGRDFRSMLENDEDLQQRHAQNPKSVNNAFSMVRRFNPEFSKDPLVAAGFVRNILEHQDQPFLAAQALVQNRPQPSTFERTLPTFIQKGLEPQQNLGLQQRLQDQRHRAEEALQGSQLRRNLILEGKRNEFQRGRDAGQYSFERDERDYAHELALHKMEMEDETRRRFEEDKKNPDAPLPMGSYPPIPVRPRR